MLSAGTTLGGRYRLDERIAGGGMGDVWRGTDEVLGRTVAIKVLLPALLEEAGFAERFRGEARTMATINHPGVVDIYDYGSEGGTAFLIMEYVEGDALSRTLSRVGRLTPARAMALVAQAADALHAAHEKGIVHRDVKPGNLLVRPNGTLVLTDFGIARSAAVAQLTAAGSVLGTASYISPEQASGAQATPLSDVYALGVVAYQCLSGQRPFEGDNPLQIAMRHVRDMPPPLPADIPPPIAQLVERAMAKDPSARWPSAAALAQAARRVSGAGGGTSAGPGIPMAAPLGPPGSPVGPPGSPVAYTPVSGPPVSGGPMSGAFGTPVSGGAPTSGAGGTRIMPGAAVPPPPGLAAVAGGHAARGAAGVPPPPSNETAYFPGDAGNYPPTGGYQPTPPSNNRPGGNRNTMVLLGVAAAVLVLLLGAGGIWYAMSGNDTKEEPGAQGTTAAATPAPTSAKPTGKTVKIPCDWNRLQSRQTVVRQLRQQGFKVKETPMDGKKPVPGQVLKVEPCGDAVPVGDIEVFYQEGGGKLPTAEPSDDNDGADESPSAGNSSQPAGGNKPSCPPGETNVGGLCVKTG
ncbi:serine/threonine-protein kinase [Dactylosporangium sp. NPDC000521]|uniref:serine/threonine-protein kinase n=1 Tax=Dactylosporangium sp. NPDC000521 TaxID=3363975 RepID=UPI0036ACFB9D